MNSRIRKTLSKNRQSLEHELVGENGRINVYTTTVTKTGKVTLSVWNDSGKGKYGYKRVEVLLP